LKDKVDQIEALLQWKNKANIQVQTLGAFRVWRNKQEVNSKEWGRDAAIQLFQFLIANRKRHSLHKEQIIDRLWGDLDQKSGLQNFKVAMHGVNKVLEPDRKSRAESKYIDRQGASYHLKLDHVWVDVEAIDQWTKIGNQLLNSGKHEAVLQSYMEATQIYNGTFLPNRLFEEWASEERERIQVSILGTFISLSEILLASNPLECIRLSQSALQIDHTWEDAYRIQMKAYLAKGNRPMALKTYKLCQEVLRKEFDIDPLPETQQLHLQILGI
jgi:DNA-binding SARP family transcriptional activator